LKVAVSVAAGVLLLLALDAAVFRSGLYASYIEPDSIAGTVQLTLLRERKHQQEWKEPLVLTMGDSRMNYSPKVANEHCASQGLPFRLTHGGVAGSNPRVWHYLLREIDPTSRRYAAIVIPVDDYDDEDSFQDYSSYPLDAKYLSLLLRWEDMPEFPLSYTIDKYRQEAWRTCLLKGPVMQPDVYAFLKNPSKRLADVKAIRDWWPNGSYDFLEAERDLRGLSVDFQAHTAQYPAWADANFKATVETVLLRPAAPQTGQLAAYRRKWFGKILERYQASPTKILFLRQPRAPFIRPTQWVQKKSHSVRDLAAPPKVQLSNENLFDDLERPEYFRDALHMNRAGSLEFSRRLADEVAQRLRN
jgi:hypothetical protein